MSLRLAGLGAAALRGAAAAGIWPGRRAATGGRRRSGAVVARASTICTDIAFGACALHLPARRSRQNVNLFLREPLAAHALGLERSLGLRPDGRVRALGRAPEVARRTPRW